MDIELISRRRGGKAVPADGREAFRRRDVRPDRRPCRSLRRHARLCQGGARRRAPRSYCATASSNSTSAPTAPGTSSPSKGNGERRARRQRGGLWAREVGRMVGLELPVLAMEHQYLITERDAGSRGFDQKEMFHVHRLRGRDLHAPGTAGHAARHLRKGRRALVAEATRHGISARTCCRPTSTASRRASKSASSISRALESAGIKQDHQRPVHFRARRQSAGRPDRGPDAITGSPAA